MSAAVLVLVLTAGAIIGPALAIMSIAWELRAADYHKRQRAAVWASKHPFRGFVVRRILTALETQS